MDRDDACNTGLSLGLAFPYQDMKKPWENCDQMFPSLTLGPSDSEETRRVALKMDEIQRNGGSFMINKNPSSRCTVSSFVNYNLHKRRRDLAIYEEAERALSSKISTDEDEEASPRKKLRLTKDQAAILEESFREHSTLTPKRKQGLAKQLNLSPRQVEVWFQNRRARTKLKQTEEDCEFLKKCCERLTEENKTLQKEIEELRSMELIRPSHYMHLPAATLSLCPTCEIKINGRSDGPSINNKSYSSFGQNYALYDSSSHQNSATI